MKLWSIHVAKPHDSLQVGKHIFISYPSSKVTSSRALADHLLSLGYPVWFNEYYILGKQYDQFEGQIQTGLKNAGKALLVTTDKYWNSKYCLQEFDYLRNNLYPTQIIEVKYPPSLNHQNQTAWPSRYFVRTDYKNVQDFIDKTWHISGNDPWPTTGPVSTFKPDWIGFKPFADVSFNFGGWEETGVYETPLQESNVLPQRSFIHRIGPLCFKMHLAINPSNGLLNSFHQTDDINDRKVFRQNLENVHAYFDMISEYGTSSKLLGNHLYFIDGMNHFAFTYWLSRPDAGIIGIVLRKYVLTFSSQNYGRDLEIVFTCGIDGIRQYSLRDFVAFTPVFDSVILSGRFCNS